MTAGLKGFFEGTRMVESPRYERFVLMHFPMPENQKDPIKFNDVANTVLPTILFKTAVARAIQGAGHVTEKIETTPELQNVLTEMEKPEVDGNRALELLKTALAKSQSERDTRAFVAELKATAAIASGPEIVRFQKDRGFDVKRVTWQEMRGLLISAGRAVINPVDELLDTERHVSIKRMLSKKKA